jgi:adenosylhomocysteine nucleosidase
MRSHAGVRTVAVALLLLVFPTGALAQSTVGVLGITAEIAPIEQRLHETGKVNAAIITTLLIAEFNPTAILFSGTAGAIDPALRQGDVVVGAIVAQHDAGLQAPDGLRRRGMRNPLTGTLDPLMLPAPESLLEAARRSAHELRLPSVRTSDGDDRTPQIVEGVIVTGDVFLSDPARRDALREALGATAIEMEGAAVVQTCRQFSVPCLVVRSITDRADGKATDNYEVFRATASENAAALVASVIGNLKAPAPR